MVSELVNPWIYWQMMYRANMDERFHVLGQKDSQESHFSEVDNGRCRYPGESQLEYMGRVPEKSQEFLSRKVNIEPPRNQFLDEFLDEWASKIHPNEVNSFLSRLGFPSLSLLSGVDPEDWIEGCEEYFDTYRSLEVYQDSLVADLLIGKAKAWYLSWSVGNEEADWDEFADALCEHFENDYEKDVKSVNCELIEEKQEVNDQEAEVGGVLLVKPKLCNLVEDFCEFGIEKQVGFEMAVGINGVAKSELATDYVLMLQNFECQLLEKALCPVMNFSLKLDVEDDFDKEDEVVIQDDLVDVELGRISSLGVCFDVKSRPPDDFGATKEMDRSSLSRNEWRLTFQNWDPRDLEVVVVQEVHQKYEDHCRDVGEKDLGLVVGLKLEKWHIMCTASAKWYENQNVVAKTRVNYKGYESFVTKYNQLKKMGVVKKYIRKFEKIKSIVLLETKWQGLNILGSMYAGSGKCSRMDSAFSEQGVSDVVGYRLLVMYYKLSIQILQGFNH